MSKRIFEVKRETLMSKIWWQSGVWICSAVVAAGVLSACGGSAPTMKGAATTQIVARYAGHELTIPEFENRYERSVGGRETAAQDSLAEYEDFLNRYVDFRLKVAEAKSIGLDQAPEIVQEIDQYEKQLSRPYLVDQEILDGLVKKLYERQQEEVGASHILVRIAPPEAPDDTLAAYLRMKTLRDSVLAGTPFADIATRNSDDPSAALNHGNLGVFSAGRMIQAFEDKAYETPVGEMSDIFRTRFGYHVLQVHSRGKKSPDIHAAHILVRATDDDTVEALAKIKEIMQKLSEGVDFSELAKRYSDDQGSAPKGGDLGFFGRGRMVPSFEDAAFKLTEIGQVSEPVRTRFGYHLIKLLEIGTLPTYQQAYDDLKTLAQRLPRFSAAEQALAAQYRAKLGSSIDTTALQGLTSSFPPDSVLFRLALNKWDDEQKATVLASVGDHAFTLKDFLDYGTEKRAAAPPSYDFGETLALLDKMLTERTLDVAASGLENRDPDFKHLMDEYRDGIVLFRIMEDSVWNRANNDSLGLMKLYGEHSDDYWFPERKRVISFYSRFDSVLTAIAASWSPGDTTDWAAKVNEEGFRVDTTFVADSTNSVYDQALALEPGQTTEPARYRRGFILFALDGLEQPRRKSLKEARADVVTLYQTQIEEQWVARLRKKYGVVLYPDNLKFAFNERAATQMDSTH